MIPNSRKYGSRLKLEVKVLSSERAKPKTGYLRLQLEAQKSLPPKTGYIRLRLGSEQTRD